MFQKMLQKFYTKTPCLIIGEQAAFYHDFSKKEPLTLNSPQDIKQLQGYHLKKPIDIYSDFSGSSYGCLSFPKLSRFELKQALKNHPDLQDKNLISASAILTKNRDIGLWRLKSTPYLSTWLKALADHHIALKNIYSLPLQQVSFLPFTEKKGLYWIAKTLDHRARHVCLLNGTIAFVRYTPLDESIQKEIKETLHFIQRDYAIDCADITTYNELDKAPSLPQAKPQKHLSWLWFTPLSQNLKAAFIALKKNQQHHQCAHFFRAMSLGLLIVSGAFLLQNSATYYQAHSHKKEIFNTSTTLPQELQSLSLKQRERLLFLAQNSQTPFKIIAILQQQNDPTFFLEEFHWQAINTTQHRLNIAVRRQGHLLQKERSDHLAFLFKQKPKLLPSDESVDRFELTLTGENFNG